jgi:hypothetical protein
MSGTSTIEVLFSVPEWISQGLKSGELSLHGGVVRRTVGKQIVAHLKEGGLLLRSPDGSGFDVSALQQALGSVESAMRLANGLGALNLALNAAGFAMVRKQLEAITLQIGTIGSDVRAVKQDTEWIGGLQLAAIRANIDTALEHADRARRTNNLALFHDAKIELVDVRNKLHHAARFMLDSRRSIERYEVFEQFMKATAIIAIGEALCDEALEGPDAAAKTLEESRSRLLSLTASFDAQRRDFATDPVTMLRLGSAGRTAIAEMHGRLVEAANQLEGAVEERRLQARLGLDAQGWRCLAQPKGAGVVTCLLVKQEAPG